VESSKEGMGGYYNETQWVDGWMDGWMEKGFKARRREREGEWGDTQG
jgi:hypothetical protein